MKYSNLLDLSMSCLRLVRQRPSDNPRIANWIASCWVVMSVIYFTLSILLIFTIKDDLDMFAIALEAMVTFMQLSVKWVPYLLHRKRFTKLYEAHKLFWDFSQCHPKPKQQIKNIYKFSYFVAWSFRTGAYITMVGFLVKPIFKKHELLMAVYVPDIPFAFEILLITQYVYTTFAAFLAVGFDLTYLAYCTHLVTQMKYVNYTLKHMDFTKEGYLEDFKKCVRHHEFLLSFARELLEVVSISLLALYMTSLFLSCMELYLFMESDGDIARILISLCYVNALYAEFAMFCFPATFFITECELVANAIYTSQWYNAPIKFRKDVGIVIHQAQREVKFMAAGLVEVNVQTFVVLFKTSLSFYMFMQNINEQKQLQT